MAEEKTIEQKAAETILQTPVEVKVGSKTYMTAPPSTATLILASEAVSRLPHVVLDPKNVVEESLSIAKDCRALGDIVAIFILGAKNLKEKVKVQKNREKSYLWGLFKRQVVEEVEEVIDRKAELAQELLEELTPAELYDLTVAKNEPDRFFRSYHFPDRNKSDAADESGNRSDSPWAIIAATVKVYGLTFEEVLYNMSYPNLILYNAVLPSYNTKDKSDGSGSGQEVIKADDPRNKERVKQFFDSIE